jgi:large subunit ribosomal protein L21
MEAYAVIQTGGKQYLVRHNELVSVEKLNAETGSTVTFDQVLAFSDGSNLSVGTPVLDGTTVTAIVMEHYRGPKVVSYKYKQRKGYQRKQGHRQEQTRLKIQQVGTATQPEPAQEAEEPAEPAATEA